MQILKLQKRSTFTNSKVLLSLQTTRKEVEVEKPAKKHEKRRTGKRSNLLSKISQLRQRFIFGHSVYIVQKGS